MELSRKLDRLKQEKSEALLKQLGGQLFRASELEKREPPPPVISSPEELFADGQTIENDCGHVFVRRVEFTPDEPRHPRGYEFPAFSSARFADPETLRRLSRDPEGDIPLTKWAILDCETTGLAGGVGTYPFLVALGWFEEERFVVEQYFMQDYDFEPALMHHLRERLADFEGLITYNGKSFDIPLLRTRFIFNRLRSAFELPHWDLLHCARRLWRRRLPSCSLGTVEDAILGHEHREHDIHGAEIPQLYFDYVRGRRRERMALVFDHNVQDICSLGALAVRVAEYFHNPEHPDIQHAEDLVGLGGLLEVCGERLRAIDCFERALLYERSPEATHLLLLHIARRYKRLERWAEAEEIWRGAIDGGKFYSVEPYVELAKCLEHQRRDFAAARDVVRRAFGQLRGQAELRQYLEGGAPCTPDDDPELAALHHRLQRLENKIARAETGPAKKRTRSTAIIESSRPSKIRKDAAVEACAGETDAE